MLQYLMCDFSTMGIDVGRRRHNSLKTKCYDTVKLFYLNVSVIFIQFIRTTIIIKIFSWDTLLLCNLRFYTKPRRFMFHVDIPYFPNISEIIRVIWLKLFVRSLLQQKYLSTTFMCNFLIMGKYGMSASKDEIAGLRKI